MKRKNQRIFTFLGAAVGTGLAAYGLRKGLQWYQQRQFTESSWEYERRNYQPMNMDRIPATGAVPAAPPMTGMTSAEQVNSDQYSDFDDRGTAFSTSEISSTRTDDLTGSAKAAGPWAETGSQGRTGQHFETDQRPTLQSTEIVMDEFAAPLIEHAIAFNSVMNLLRSRQREGVGSEGTESLTEGDRNSMRAVLNQMQEHVMEQDEATMRRNPLAMRSLTLTRKLRDALDNITYSGTDLYRIQGEVRKELCVLTRDLENSGKVTITGLDHIRQLYECQ